VLSLTIPDPVTVGEDRRRSLSATLTSNEDRSLRTASMAIVALAPFDIIGLTISEGALHLLGDVPQLITVFIGGRVVPGTYRRRANLRCGVDDGQLLSNWADFIVGGDD
jgi:hypothetical protein